MSDFLRDPPRWKERADQARLAERAAGQMVRDLGAAEPLSDVQLARIAARVRAQRSHPRRLRFWVPAMTVLLFGGVAAASAAHIDILPGWLLDIVRPRIVVPAARPISSRSPRLKPSTPGPALTPAPTPTPQPRTVPVEPGPMVEVVAPVQQPAAPLPATALAPSPSEPVRGPIRKSAAKLSESKPFQPSEGRPFHAGEARAAVTLPDQASSSQPSAVPPQPASVALPTGPIVPVVQVPRLAWVDQRIVPRRPEPAHSMPETRAPLPAPASPTGGPLKVLSSAVHALRVEHAPEAALAMLDSHAGELEKSSVSHEALLLRVEAMLKLNRKPEVLQLLDAAPLAGVAASRTLLLTRGELRASAGRCAEAVADFDLVLVQTQGHNKRALAGKANCQE